MIYAQIFNHKKNFFCFFCKFLFLWWNRRQKRFNIEVNLIKLILSKHLEKKLPEEIWASLLFKAEIKAFNELKTCIWALFVLRQLATEVAFAPFNQLPWVRILELSIFYSLKYATYVERHTNSWTLLTDQLLVTPSYKKWRLRTLCNH